MKVKELTSKEFEKILEDRIRSIPKNNMKKFLHDLIILINKAHEEDYDKFEIE